uniref:ATP synthase F0 subunit 8 n=1 Tax=Eupolyphaga hanae TaxID=2972401 RepID=UPI00279C5F19|nr:ATP synthase F0 subunit 8 [Eupolyphaga hanae]WGO57824.1 ATP synthase F0 subunit 8 [Eupolyphaga hanae]
MPQMMPLNWLMLYFMFIIALLLFNFMNYYLFNPIKDMMKLHMKIKHMHWKW